MSSLPRPMVSVGKATSLPPLPGPAPSPSRVAAGGRLQLTRALRTLAAASWRRRRDAAPPGCHSVYFIYGHKRR